MKKFLLFTAAVGIALSAGAARNDGGIRAKIASAQATVNRITALNESQAAKWYAQTKSEYYWDQQANQWGPATVTKYTFDNQNRVIREARSGGYAEYTYDSEGRVATELNYLYRGVGEEGPQLTAKVTYTYDSILKNFVVRQTVESEGYNAVFGHEITRNADNNIVKIQDYNIVDGGTPDYSSFLEIGYGPDGKAVTIDDGEIYEGQKDYYSRLKDIKWENTDGQIVECDFEDVLDPLYFGNNRIKSATVTDDEWPLPAKLTVAYDGINYKSSLVMTNNEKLLSIDFKSLDDNGSYISDCYEVDYDDDGEGNHYIDGTSDSHREVSIDRFGLELKDIMTDVYHNSDGDETSTEGTRGTVTYDPVHGYPTEYIIAYKLYDSDEYVNSIRTVFSDYTAGVEGVEADSDDAAPVEYYNLQGVRVVNPSAGLYIRVQGNKAVKTVIR